MALNHFRQNNFKASSFATLVNASSDNGLIVAIAQESNGVAVLGHLSSVLAVSVMQASDTVSAAAISSIGLSVSVAQESDAVAAIISAFMDASVSVLQGSDTVAVIINRVDRSISADRVMDVLTYQRLYHVSDADPSSRDFNVTSTRTFKA